MNILRRSILLAKRMAIARRFGVRFRGVSGFVLPRRFLLLGRELELSAPDECSLRSDFVNLLLDDEYGLRRLIAPPRTICDIGGNIGLFSLWARHCFPEATIHCYEPNDRVLEHLRTNLKGAAVELFAEAVGASEGRVVMKDERDSRNARTQLSDAGGIPMVPFQKVIDRLGGDLDLLKLDCEGGEWDILRAPGSLARVRLIRMEYHLSANGGKTLPGLFDLIRAQGFQCERLDENQGFGIVWLRNTGFGR